MNTTDPEEPNMPDSAEDLNLIPGPDWPPWLEGLTRSGKIAAIVDAVAREYADIRPVSERDPREPHCTAAIAVMLLEGLLAPEAAGQDEAEPEDPPLPEGVYGRVEMPGYRQDTGWITEETRFGQQMAVVRDWAGRETAAVAVGPACRVVYLPTPMRRPEAQERAALTSACHHPEGYYDQDPDDLDDSDPRPF